MRADGAAFLVDATYRRDGTRTQRLRIAQNGHMTRIRCHVRGSWRFAEDWVKISVPTICLGEGYGDQRMSAETKWPLQMNPNDTTRRVSVPFN